MRASCLNLSSHLGRQLSGPRRRAGGPLLLLGLLWLSSLGPSAAAEPQRIQDSAWRQIAATGQVKRGLTPPQRKLDTRLLVEVLRARRDARLAELPALSTDLESRGNHAVLLDLRARVTAELERLIESLGGTIVSSFPRWDALRAWLPLTSVEAVAARSEVRQIRPADRMRSEGNSVISQGDVAHRANLARAQLNITGAGVTSCAMSDSVDQLANLQASGELPAGVTVLTGQSGNPGTSEGTALLEILHDLAPGADLIFATGKGGQAQMAQNILDLAAAGCDVIADDVFYFAEPAFQDGVIAQAVDQVAAAGVLYFSSAGNSGRLNAGTSGVWEGDFLAGAVPSPLVGAGLAAHDFGDGETGNTVTEQTGNDAPFFTLAWSNPLGAANDDYDLFLLDATLTNVVAFSTNVQDGDDDPLEAISSIGLDHSGNRLVVLKFSGDDQFLQLNTHRGILELGTNGQITGHAAAQRAFAVAAVNVATAGGGAFTGGPANPVEPFSSDGPRRIFFNADGSPVTGALASSPRGPTFVTRSKPDISAADGVNTTTPGFTNFFGTSASVPHVSAIATLLRQLNPNADDVFLRQSFSLTALDIEDPGFDFDSGHGIADANELTRLIFTDGFESGNTSSWTQTVP